MQINKMLYWHMALFCLYALFCFLLILSCLSCEYLIYEPPWINDPKAIELVARLVPSFLGLFINGWKAVMSKTQETEEGLSPVLGCPEITAVICSVLIGIWAWFSLSNGWVMACICLLVATMIDSPMSSVRNVQIRVKHRTLPLLWFCITHRKTKYDRYIIPQLIVLNKHLDSLHRPRQSVGYCKEIFRAFIGLCTYKKQWCKKGGLLDNPKLLTTAADCFHVCRSYYAGKGRADEFITALSLSFVSNLLEYQNELGWSFLDGFLKKIVWYEDGFLIFTVICTTINDDLEKRNDLNTVLFEDWFSDTINTIVEDYKTNGGNVYVAEAV